MVKDGSAMERLAEADAVVFDKTGTLTMGLPEPQDFDALPRRDLEAALALADASSHPLARALVKAGRDRGLRPAPATDLAEVPGYGVEGTVRGQRARLGRATWIGTDGVPETATYLRVGQGAPVAIRFADSLRPGAETAVEDLRAMGKRLILISGDADAAVRAFAARIGIDEVVSEALPEDKARMVADLAAQGHKVLMVGDGLNDTAALAAAHVSISPATALDAARVASDIVLMNRDLGTLGDAVRTAVSARARIKENFRISALYNVVAVPIALLGFATPLAAAAAMSLSSITVSLNALRVR
jgi:P-type Cu2+ transporter